MEEESKMSYGKKQLLDDPSFENLKAYVTEVNRQISSAKEIQNSILPDKLPTWNCVKFAARYIAMDEIGGDYYDAFKIKGDRLGLIMADVSGHGIPAALVTTMAKVAFATHGRMNISTKELLYKVNKDLTSLIADTGFYMTCFAINIDKNLNVRYTNAGHQKAILYRNETDTFEHLDTNGLFLGAFEDAGETYEEGEVKLYPGDRIILYTDGIVETRNKNKVEYGDEKFEEMIRFSCALESEQVVDLVVDDIIRHAEGTKIRDDVSILVLEVELRYQKYLDMIKEAGEAEKVGNLEKWEEDLLEAIRINPDSLVSRKRLAIYHIKHKNYEKALEHLKIFVEKNQESVKVYTLLGFCYYKLDNIIKAIDTTKVALHLNPKYIEAVQNMVLYHIKISRFDISREYLVKLIELDPDNKMIEPLTRQLNF